MVIMGGKHTGDRNNPRARCVELNEFISCSICGGYLIDATTVTECLHSFCKTCIVKHLKTDNSCPRCQTLVHKTQPLRGLRSDPTLQDIVYKVVPGLYKDEMIRRKSLYQENPDAAKSITSGEERGEYSGERTIYSSEDIIPISLQYVPREITYSYQPMHRTDGPVDDNLLPHSLSNAAEHGQVRFFRCVSAVTVRILKKLLRHKFDLKYHHEVQLFYKHDHLLDEYSILDLAYIYSWKRNVPLSLFYKISDLRTVTTKSATKVPAAKRKSTTGSQLPAVVASTTPLPASEPKSAAVAATSTNGTKSPAVRPPAGRRVPPAVVPHVPLTPVPTPGPKIPVKVPVTMPISISTSPQPVVNRKHEHQSVTPASHLSGLEAIRREAAAHLLKEEESTRPVTPVTSKQSVTATCKPPVTSSLKQSVPPTGKQPVTSSSGKQPVTPVSQLSGLEAIRREAAAHLLKEEENQRKQSQMSTAANQTPVASRSPASTPAANPLTQNLKRMSQLVDNIRPAAANGTAGSASAQSLDGIKKRKIVREPRGRKPKGQSNGTSSVRHRPATVRDLIVPQTPDYRTIAPAPHPFSFLYQAFLPAGKSLQQHLQQQQQLQQLRQPVMQKSQSLTAKQSVPDVSLESQQTPASKQQPASGPTPGPASSHVVQPLPTQGPGTQTEAKQSQSQSQEKTKSPPAATHPTTPQPQQQIQQNKSNTLPAVAGNDKPQTALQAARQLLNIATSPSATSATSNIFSNSELTITVTNSAAATPCSSGSKSPPPLVQAVTAAPVTTTAQSDVGLDLSRTQPVKGQSDDPVSKEPVPTPVPATTTSTVRENNEDVVILSAQKPAESPPIPCPSVT